MKRIVTILLAMVMAIALLPALSLTAHAEQELLDSGACGLYGYNVTWTLDETGTLTISGKGPMKDYGTNETPWYSNKQLVRKVVVEDGVTTVGGYVFWQCSNLYGFVCSDTVTSIGKAAFFECTNLTEVQLGASVASIGRSAFYGCRQLRSIELPDPLTVIQEATFADCSLLESVKLGDSVTRIEPRAFMETRLKAVDLPDTLTEIGSQAFYSTNLASIEIPDSVTSIGSGAFTGTNLASIEIPDSVTSIGSCAFLGIGALKNVKLPNSLTEISWGLFRGSGITSIEIPNSVTSIGDRAFANTSLTSIQIPDSVTFIDYQAFDECRKLERVEISASVKYIGENAFRRCSELKEIVFKGDAPEIEGNAFFSAGFALGCYALYPANNGTWTDALHQKFDHVLNWIGYHDTMWKAYGQCGENVCWTLSEDGILNIFGEGTMYGFSRWIPSWNTYRESIKTVVIENGVTDIGKEAFSGCSNLERVKIPSSVTALGNGAFTDCTSLDEIWFGGAAPSFGENVFSAVTATAYYSDAQDTWTEAVRQDHGGKITWVTYHGVPENAVVLPDKYFAGHNTVWIDGLPYGVETNGNDRYVKLSVSKDCYLVTYTYHTGDGQDVHTQYPTGMKVYLVSNGEVTYIPELDNLLQYSGSSIRIAGKKGIRMITALTKDNKKALTGNGLAGFTLQEYGTALCFASEIQEGDALILGREFTRSNYAYKKDVNDPVFASPGNLIQYTNVLVGFTQDQCKEDIAMRPYIILKDGQGNQITLYGGTIYRSIGYIAYQNRTVFQPKTNAYNFVWEIIHHVYDDQYDADYKG